MKYNSVKKGAEIDIGVRPYKTYVAFFSQTGTNAPVATVLENTLDGEIVWGRGGVGNYYGVLSGAFTLGKTIAFANIGAFHEVGGAFVYITANTNVNAIGLVTLTSAGAFADNLLFGTGIEIRVYP